MKVKELIKKLHKCNPDAEVWIDIYDDDGDICSNEVHDVVPNEFQQIPLRSATIITLI